MLETGKVHFHRIGDFSDPFEGTIPKAIKEDRDRHIDNNPIAENISSKNLKEAWKLTSRTAETTLFVNSWHSNREESAAMWNLYGDGSNTVAIRSTVANLQHALDPIPEEVLIGSVSYVNFYQDKDELSKEDRETLNDKYYEQNTTETLYPAFLKRKEFDHENELRAVIQDLENYEIEEGHGGFPELSAERNYYNVSVDMEQLINKIYIAPNPPDWLSEAVKSYIGESKYSLSREDVVPSKMGREPVR